MPRVIIPAGLSMGPHFRYVRPPDPVPECYLIHLGDDQVELAENEAIVWAAAFVDAERHARLEVNRLSLLYLLATAPQPVPHSPVIVDDLLRRGLLVEFDTDGDLEPVFGRHRLFPLGQGLGSTAEEPDRHRVGFANQPYLYLPSDAYGLWSFSCLHPNLWEACSYYAAADKEELEEDEEPLGLTPQSVARELAINLPMLVAANCAFFDPAVP